MAIVTIRPKKLSVAHLRIMMTALCRLTFKSTGTRVDC